MIFRICFLKYYANLMFFLTHIQYFVESVLLYSVFQLVVNIIACKGDSDTFVRWEFFMKV